MTCFTAWILPNFPLEEAAKKLGLLLGIPLIDGRTNYYNEYPAYMFDFFGDESVFVALLGSPGNLEELMRNFPEEFDEKDRNYSVIICSHEGLPIPEKVGLNLPWRTDFDFATGVIRVLRDGGFELYEKKLPYTTSENGRTEYPLIP